MATDVSTTQRLWVVVLPCSVRGGAFKSRLLSLTCQVWFASCGKRSVQVQLEFEREWNLGQRCSRPDRKAAANRLAIRLVWQ